MRHLALALAAGLALAAAPAAGSVEQRVRPASPQQVDLDVSTGDGATVGHATLWANRAAHGGFDVSGEVSDAYGSKGCITLAAVEMHAGLTTSGDNVTRVCSAGETRHIRFHTAHRALVLRIEEPWWAPNWNSRTVTLTG